MAFDLSEQITDLFLMESEWKRFFRRGSRPPVPFERTCTHLAGALLQRCGLYVKRGGPGSQKLVFPLCQGACLAHDAFCLQRHRFQNSSHGHKIKREVESLWDVLSQGVIHPFWLSWESHPHTEVPLTPAVPVKANFKNGKDEPSWFHIWTHQLNSICWQWSDPA